MGIEEQEQERHGYQTEGHSGRASSLDCSVHIEETGLYNGSYTGMQPVRETLPQFKDCSGERLVGAVLGTRTADLSEEI